MLLRQCNDRDLLRWRGRDDGRLRRAHRARLDVGCTRPAGTATVPSVARADRPRRPTVPSGGHAPRDDPPAPGSARPRRLRSAPVGGTLPLRSGRAVALRVVTLRDVRPTRLRVQDLGDEQRHRRRGVPRPGGIGSLRTAQGVGSQ
ncbi:hypothetical protein FTX61_09440 [Nitriliruptoraceae bacterium ZYF776]|nr:hypothetical protein [Profundirhabdus halotolerans]